MEPHQGDHISYIKIIKASENMLIYLTPRFNNTSENNMRTRTFSIHTCCTNPSVRETLYIRRKHLKNEKMAGAAEILDL